MNNKLLSLERSIMSILSEKADKNSINFGIGEPVYATPKQLKDKAKEFIEHDTAEYGPVAGLPSLRKYLASCRSYAFDTHMENVVITCGATEALSNTLCALLNPGDEVIYPNPGFIVYNPMIKMLNAIPIPLRFTEEENFDMNIERLKNLISDRTKAIIVNSPNNPTGAVYNKKKIEQLSTLAEKHNFYIVSDEVYDLLLFDKEHTSPAEYTDRSIVIGSISKLFRFAGYRVGWAISNKDLSPVILKAHQYTTFRAPTTNQRIALTALEDTPLLDEMRQYYRNNRTVMQEGLDNIPKLSYSKPEGTFFVWVNVSHYGSAWDVALRLAKRGLIVTPNSGPGQGFGDACPYHIRLSFAQKPEEISKGTNIIRDVLCHG